MIHDKLEQQFDSVSKNMYIHHHDPSLNDLHTLIRIIYKEVSQHPPT